jgi:hypothetical protein
MDEGVPVQASKFSLYLSHSWRPADVDLNVYLWRHLSQLCTLLVDDNAGGEPPYFINRIEEYIRRADLFFAVLTDRSPTKNDGSDAEPPPWCSKASLFEVRLAERARKPRFVLYERGCAFEPPEDDSDFVRYQVFDRVDLLKMSNSNADQAIREWLDAIETALRPRRFMFHEASLALVPGSSTDLVPVLKRALLEGGYTKTRTLEAATTDYEILNKLATTGLLVADVTVTELSETMAMAHAVFLPTIRIAKRPKDGAEITLPWFLRGHPSKGYEADIVYYDQAQDLLEPVRARARAMRDTRIPIASEAEGRLFFERRRWKPHYVFVSHALKGAPRAVVDALLVQLREKAVDAWEYVGSGESGADWKTQLDQQLARATHAVVIVDDGFDKSDICLHELEYLTAAERKVRVLPFQLAGSAARSVLIRELHHEALRADPEEAARQILAKVIESVRA